MILPRSATSGLLLALLVVAADQATKQWIISSVMVPPQVIEITSFFNLVLVWNRGVSFGLFNSGAPIGVWILSGLAVAIVSFLVVWLWRAESRLATVSLGLIIGGAIGNVIDRLHYGAVMDFLDFYIGGYHWPAFNVADSAITVGAVLFVSESLFGASEKPKLEK
jgi:signal peptidase II